MEKKINDLIKNIILLQGQTDRRQKLIESEYLKSKNALDEAGRSLNGTAHGIKELTSDMVAQALDRPLGNFEQRAQELERTFAAVAARLNSQQQEAQKRLKIFQWTGLTVLATASLISVGSAVWMMKYAKREINRSQWVADINKAVEKGRLTRCADGSGICTNVKGREVRLDK